MLQSIVLQRVGHNWEPKQQQMALVVKNLPGNAGGCKETQIGSLGGKIPWRREWWPTPVSLPGEFHGQRSLAGYSPWGCRVRRNLACMHTHIMWFGECSTLQCSCLENPRDGVAKSWTQLKWLSSSTANTVRVWVLWSSSHFYHYWA